MATNVSSYGIDGGAMHASQVDPYTGRVINGRRQDALDSQNTHGNAFNNAINAAHARSSSSGSRAPPKELLVHGSALGATLANAGSSLGDLGYANAQYNPRDTSSFLNPGSNHLGHRPDLKLNLSNQQGSMQHEIAAAINSAFQMNGHGLGLENPQPNPQQLSDNVEGGSNHLSFIPNTLSPLSAATPLHPSSQPHSPSADQVPPASPFQISPHSPFSFSPDGAHSAVGLSPLFQQPTQSPVSLSPHFGPSQSSREPSPIRPSSANPHTRHGKQWTVDSVPLGGDLSRWQSGKMRGRSSVPRTNTASGSLSWEYGAQDPSASPNSTVHHGGHGRFASGTQIPRSPNLHARNPSGNQTKRNDAVESRFQRGRGHSVGSVPENNSVMARAGSNAPRSRGTSPYMVPSSLPGHRANDALSVPLTDLTIPGIPGGLALTVENLALNNAAYPNSLMGLNIQRASSHVGSVSDLGDVNGPEGSGLTTSEFQFDISHSSHLLAPPVPSPRTPQSGPLGSPHLSPISPHLLSSQLDFMFPFEAPSPGQQLPPPSPIEPISGASSPFHATSPLASPLYRSPNELPMNTNGPLSLDVPLFDDLGSGLFAGSSPPVGLASTSNASLAQLGGSAEQSWNLLDVSNAQAQANQIRRMEEETRMQLDSFLDPPTSEQHTQIGENFGGNMLGTSFGLGLDGSQLGTQSQGTDSLSNFHLIPSPQTLNEVLPSPVGARTPESLMHPDLFQPSVGNGIHDAAGYGSSLTGSTSSPAPSASVGFDGQGIDLASLPIDVLQALQQQQALASLQDMQSNSSNTLEVPKAKRPNPSRRRSRSALDAPFYRGQNNVQAQLNPLFTSVGGGSPHAAPLSAHPDFVDENTVLGGPGPSQVRARHSASAAMSTMHKRAHSSFDPPPAISVTNWDSDRIPSISQTQRPNISHSLSMTPSGESYQASASALHPTQTLLQHNPQVPPLVHSTTYPPPNPVPTLPNSVVGGASVQRVSSHKARQQGQRHEINQKLLDDAFTSRGFFPDPALRRLFELILCTQFYKDESLEPMLGTPEADALLEQIRLVAPHDARFAPRDPSTETTPAESADRDTQSIYMLFTENNECLICGKKTDRSGRALGHVRSDINHRPYHCTCDKCRNGNNPRKFFSDNLLDDHLKGQTHKQKCTICGNLFRRGGMKRHMNSKHPNIEYHQTGDDQDNEE